MIWFTTLLLVLPFAAVVMVIWLGVVRTAALCCGLLLLYVVGPFLYFAVRSFEYADATIADTWATMMEADILVSLMHIVSVCAQWTVVGILGGAVLQFCWQKWRKAA